MKRYISSSSPLKTYKFKDGHTITSKLSPEEVMKRMQRLDWLRVLTEGYEEGEGASICRKALQAYNKTDNFTGIIKLNATEKDFLGYMLEGEFNSEKDNDTIKFYLRQS